MKHQKTVKLDHNHYMVRGSAGPFDFTALFSPIETKVTFEKNDSKGFFQEENFPFTFKWVEPFPVEFDEEATLDLVEFFSTYILEPNEEN